MLCSSSFFHLATKLFVTLKNLVTVKQLFQTVRPAVLSVPTYHALHFWKAALPADVDESGCNNDHAHWANDHQHDK